MSLPNASQVDSPRALAIIPAAGSSRRMGEDKLLLPWGEGVVMDAVIDAYHLGGVIEVVVVIQSENTALTEYFRARDVSVVVPSSPPAEMKDSVRLALAHIQQHLSPQAGDLWLLAPADLPTLSADVVRQVVFCSVDHPGDIIVPTHAGRRGHPTAFPWALADAVSKLAADEGVNAMLATHPVFEIDCGPAATPPDIDTPQAYRHARKHHDDQRPREGQGVDEEPEA